MARVMITVPDEFLKEIDAVANEEHRSRSELIREAMRVYFAVRGRKSRSSLLDKPSVQRALQIQEETSEKLAGSGWDGVAEIRRWRGEL